MHVALRGLVAIVLVPVCSVADSLKTGSFSVAPTGSLLRAEGDRIHGHHRDSVEDDSAADTRSSGDSSLVEKKPSHNVVKRKSRASHNPGRHDTLHHQAKDKHSRSKSKDREHGARDEGEGEKAKAVHPSPKHQPQGPIHKNRGHKVHVGHHGTHHVKKHFQNHRPGVARKKAGREAAATHHKKQRTAGLARTKRRQEPASTTATTTTAQVLALYTTLADNMCTGTSVASLGTAAAPIANPHKPDGDYSQGMLTCRGICDRYSECTGFSFQYSTGQCHWKGGSLSTTPGIGYDCVLKAQATSQDALDKCDWQCYLNRYKDVRTEFGVQSEASAAAHWNQTGKMQDRVCTCPMYTYTKHIYRWCYDDASNPAVIATISNSSMPACREMCNRHVQCTHFEFKCPKMPNNATYNQCWLLSSCPTKNPPKVFWREGSFCGTNVYEKMMPSYTNQINLLENFNGANGDYSGRRCLKVLNLDTPGKLSWGLCPADSSVANNETYKYQFNFSLVVGNTDTKWQDQKWQLENSLFYGQHNMTKMCLTSLGAPVDRGDLRMKPCTTDRAAIDFYRQNWNYYEPKFKTGTVQWMELRLNNTDKCMQLRSGRIEDGLWLRTCQKDNTRTDIPQMSLFWTHAGVTTRDT